MQTQVLILSADAVFARMLEIELEMQKISVRCMADASRACRAEIVLLDLDTALPPEPSLYRQMIGFTRKSATAGEETGRLCSLVLRRPFEMRLLRNELFHLLDGQNATQNDAKPTLLAFALTADAVKLPDGRSVTLSPKEHAVFDLLLAHHGEVVSREAISAAIGESSANKADVYICYLRRKLETPEHRVIQTVRGKGYRLI